jgi:hypothetical protein
MLAHERLVEVHGLPISLTTVRKWMFPRSARSAGCFCCARWLRRRDISATEGELAPCTVDDLAPLLAAQTLPNLRWLELRKAPFADELPDALCSSKVTRGRLGIGMPIALTAGGLFIGAATVLRRTWGM